MLGHPVDLEPRRNGRAHGRASATAGYHKRRVFALPYDRSPRHPFESAPYAIFQVWKNAAPMITVAHE